MSLPRWTHLALRVNDLDATIAFYAEHTPLSLLAEREDDAGRSAWMGHTDAPDSPFILVVVQFHPGCGPDDGTSTRRLGPFSHIGIELAERSDVDEIADRARAGGWLQAEPIDLPEPVGYVCMVTDPDGNTIEFSHGQNVLEFARDHPGIRAPD